MTPPAPNANAEARSAIQCPSDKLQRWSVNTCMSNFDGSIEPDAESVLREHEGRAWSHYAGWNFNGHVWFQAGEFHCEVWVYGSPRTIISAPTLAEIMEKVSDEYGRD